MEESDERKKLAQLYEQRRGLVEQLKKLRARKEELVAELDDLAGKLQGEREEYKSLRERLRLLNESRRKLADEIKDSKKRFKDAAAQLSNMKPALRMHGEDMERELKELEWKMQTQTLTRDEEKKLLARMRDMASMISTWKRAYELRDQASKLDRELDEKAATLFDVKADRQEAIKQIEERRAKMDEYTKAGKQVYTEVESLVQDIYELENKFREITKEIEQLKSKVETEERIKRQERREAHLAASKEAIQRAREQALEKMRRGESISFYDLKLLYDEDNVK
jgi:uncharacterized coiled-coil DUF342 family protein